jgi:hypothetical protein
MNDYRGLSKGLKGRLRIKLCIRNQSVRRRFQAETLPFLGAGPDIMAARSRDCSNSMAPMRGGGIRIGRNEFRSRNGGVDVGTTFSGTRAAAGTGLKAFDVVRSLLKDQTTSRTAGWRQQKRPRLPNGG